VRCCLLTHISTSTRPHRAPNRSDLSCIVPHHSEPSRTVPNRPAPSRTVPNRGYVVTCTRTDIPVRGHIVIRTVPTCPASSCIVLHRPSPFRTVPTGLACLRRLSVRGDRRTARRSGSGA